jgi:hypothetical protein
MSQVCDRVEDRLKQLKDERRKLQLSDFAELELESNTVHRCLVDFEAKRWIEMRVPLGSVEGRKVVADVSVYIIDEGREEFEN